MNPSSSHASVGDDGPSPEEKGGGGRGQHPQGGNGAKLCAVSLDGDEDARRASCGSSVSRTRRAENAQFCAGSRRRNSQVAPRCGLKLVAVADAAPGNWTFLEKLRPDERAVDFFMHGEVSDRRERLVRKIPRHPARRRRLQGRAISEAFALCHFLPVRHPAGTRRIAPAAPPAGPQGPCGRSIFRTKGNIRSLRRCAANPGRAGPRRRQPVSGGRRSVAQPDRANQRPPWRSARRQPGDVATTVTRPSRRRRRQCFSAGVVDPAVDPVPASRRGCPRGSA